MPILDTPIRRLFDRTPRELVLLAMASLATYACFGAWPEFATSLGVTLIFALRIPQARPIAVGFALGWVLSISALMRASHTWDWQNPRLLLPAAMLLLLTSRDLFERFDAAPARFIPNVWRELPKKHWRMMRWCAYGLGVLASLVTPGWLWTSMYWKLSTTAPMWILIGIVVALALLVLGSALGFIVAFATASYTLITLAPHLDDKVLLFTQYGLPGMQGPICAAALAVLLLSSPYCLRLFYRR